MKTETEGAPAPPEAGATWPNPTDWPLYVTVERAAEITGVSYQTMRSWVDSRADPIPHLRMGKAKALVRTAAIPEYAKTKEEP